MPNLEQEITSTLKATDISSTDVGKLIERTEIAITDGEATLTAAREKALDLGSDPQAATAAITAAQLTIDRLQNVLPELDEKYQKALGVETYAAWDVDFQVVKARHAAAVKRLTKAAQALPELVETLAEAKAADQDSRRIMANKPRHLRLANSDGKELLSVECTARNTPYVDGEHSLMNLKLSFSDVTQFDWPPQQTSFAAEVVASMHFPSGPGENWHETIAARNAERLEGSKRTAEYYKSQQEQKEKREAAENKAAFAAEQARRRSA
jgi:hypothetical protein